MDLLLESLFQDANVETPTTGDPPPKEPVPRWSCISPEELTRILREAELDRTVRENSPDIEVIGQFCAPQYEFIDLV